MQYLLTGNSAVTCVASNGLKLSSADVAGLVT